jgi:glycosyltransferase involved in cell wall biosynthesis
VHSDRNKEALAALCPNSTQKIRVIPLATQESLINHLEKYTAREALSLPQGDKVIIYFGNIRPYKGVDILIKSFATIVTELPETTLVIAGKPWISWDPFEKMIESLGLSSKIKTKLYRITSKEISLLFSSADLLILPYMNFEAQSGPGRLALGYGLPMVVTDVGGLPELVGYSEQCIVPPGDDKRIAASALCILQDPLLSKTLGEFALAKSRSFQWADNIRETLSIYHF